MPARRYTAAALLAAFALAAAAAAAEDGDKGISKLKKTSSLFPHPRIGRSEFINHEAGSGGQKRAAGLFQFPRVGRAFIDAPLPFPLSVVGPLRLAPSDKDADAEAATVAEQPSPFEGHKRKGLVANARVGRRDGAETPGAAASLWFGPRVGRAGLGQDETRAGTKRRGLLAFPRVGRGHAGSSSSSSSGDGDGDGARDSLWFGPRVGRRERRSLRLRLPAAAWLAAGDVGNGKGDFTPRLGRESGEEEATVLLVGDGNTAEGFDAVADADIDEEER
nr:CAPA transcript a-3 [Schistocerca gregaria]